MVDKRVGRGGGESLSTRQSQKEVHGGRKVTFKSKRCKRASFGPRKMDHPHVDKSHSRNHDTSERHSLRQHAAIRGNCSSKRRKNRDRRVPSRNGDTLNSSIGGGGNLNCYPVRKTQASKGNETGIYALAFPGGGGAKLLHRFGREEGNATSVGGGLPPLNRLNRMVKIGDTP